MDLIALLKKRPDLTTCPVAMRLAALLKLEDMVRDGLTLAEAHRRIRKEGAPAVREYKKFLSGGSSMDPVSLLKIAGVDMSTPDPVNDALALFGELVDELEALK